MKTARLLLPHLTIALALALAVVAIVDNYNPAMAFLSSAPGRTLIFLSCAASLLTAILSVAGGLRERSCSEGAEEPDAAPAETDGENRFPGRRE